MAHPQPPSMIVLRDCVLVTRATGKPTFSKIDFATPRRFEDAPYPRAASSATSSNAASAPPEGPFQAPELFHPSSPSDNGKETNDGRHLLRRGHRWMVYLSMAPRPLC
jgi:hypothetical protein